MRAFITVGSGGVGQSRFTCLIANLFGGSHGFMDMNVFYTEDELRKQAKRAHRVFPRSSPPAHRQTAPRRTFTRR